MIARAKHVSCARFVLVFGILALPIVAHATLDPSKAEANRQAILKDDDYSFCTKPGSPLSRNARSLCPLAAEIPGCAALVTECAAEEPKPPELGDFWKKLFHALSRMAPYVAWTLVGVLALLVLYLAFLAIRATRTEVMPAVPRAVADAENQLATDEATAVTAAEALFARATLAHRRGDLREALSLYLAAALRALGERGAIRITRDRTNGEYVQSCKETASRPPLRDLVRQVDLVQFGGGVASEETLTMAEARAESIVRARPRDPLGDAGRFAVSALTLLLLGTLAVGCGPWRGGDRDDPAGRDLFTELLAREGAKISSLPGSLSSLPLHGVNGPALVLDAERVPLEDETRVHLVAWVKQGGTLVLVGDPGLWPSELWAKRTSTACETTPVEIRLETRTPASAAPDDDDDAPSSAPVVRHAKVAHAAAMTWPSDDRTPKVVARLPDGELYGALRAFGDGEVLGFANAELLSNAGLAVPGNAEAVVAMLATLGKDEFSVARTEQGIAPPTNPLGGLLRIGLGPALLHAALFLPLLFAAFAVRQKAPRQEPPERRRAFAEHVRAVGALYARRGARSHALAVYAKHIDDRLRARLGRWNAPAQFLAARSGADPGETAALYARALRADDGSAAAGDELRVLQRLAALYARAMTPG